MIPVPTKWGELASRSTGAWTGCWIVKFFLVDGGGTDKPLYISDTEMQLGTDHVFGFMDGLNAFGRNIDIYKSTYNFAHAIVRVNDKQFLRSTNYMIRMTDDRKMVEGAFDLYLNLHGCRCQIILHPGAYATAISDGLVLLDGTVMNYEYDNGKTSFYVDERRRIVHRDLPQRRFTKTLFPALPLEFENDTMPLVYGPHNELSYLRNTGFAPGTRVAPWKWLIADHVSDAFVTEPRVGGPADTQAAWIWIDELQSWARSYVGVTFNTNDAGQTTIVIDPDNAGFDVYIYPTNSTPTSSGTDSLNPLGADAVRDFDVNTKQTVLANSTTQAEIIFEWRQQGDESDDDKNNSVAELPGPATALQGLDLAATKDAGVTITSASLDWWNGSGWVNFASAISTSTSAMNHYPIGTGTNLFYGAAQSMRWHLGTGPSFTSPGAPDRKPFKIRARFNGSGWTAHSTRVAYIHEARLTVSCKTPRDSATTVGTKTISERVPEINVLGQKTGRTVWVNHHVPVADIDTRIVGASIQGREYGSWIDNGGRSNPHNSGDQISNAPGIIEDILRTELLVPTGDIDQPSFDAAYSDSSHRYSAKLHLASNARRNSKGVLEDICSEHGMILVHRPNGQLRLLRMPGSGELVATLTLDDLVDQNIKIWNSNLSLIRNHLTISYNRMADSGRFLRSLAVEPVSATSENRYGSIPDEIQLRTHSDITSTSPAPIALYDWLLDDLALLAKPHMFVSFEVRGFRWAHAELGDVFQFSELDVREVRRRFGESWSNVDLMIYDMVYKPQSLYFSCIVWAPV